MIVRQLAGLRRRERGLTLLWGLSRALTVAAAVLVLACLADWTIDLWQETPWPLRFSLLAVQVMLWAVLVSFLVLRPLFHRLSDGRLALHVEERVPDFQHRLISAVQLNQPGAAVEGMSREMIDAVTRQAEEQSSRLHFAALADHRRLLWSLSVVAPLALSFGILVFLWPETVMALLARQFLAERDIPRSLLLECEQAERVCPAGEEVVLRFLARGNITSQPQGEIRIAPEGQPAENYPLEIEKQDESGATVFLARIPPTTADLTYHARLQDARTHHPGRVHFEAQPAVVQLRAWTQLPEYCGRRPSGKLYEREQPGGDLAVLPESTARVAIRTQKPIALAYLEMLAVAGNKSEHDTEEHVLRRINLAIQQDGQSAEGSFTPREGETAYRVVVSDAYGFRNVDPPRRGIHLLPDELPRVALLPELFPSPDERGTVEDYEVSGIPVPLGGSIRIAYTCSSPFGLGRADQNRTPRLRYRVNEGAWRRLPLKEVAASDKTGPFDPRYGAFEKSSFLDQVEYHAVPSPDPETTLGRREGGGRFDLQTRRIPGLRIGDRLEMYLEVYDQNPSPGREPGRSESRIKTIVTLPEVETWVRETLQEESRIRQLAGKQESIFALARIPEDDPVRSRTEPVVNEPQAIGEQPLTPATPFVRAWQLIGPFECGVAGGHGQVYSPEVEPIDLIAAYEGVKGKVRWKIHRSDSDRIDLVRVYGISHSAVAYGVCWVYSDKPRKIKLAAGSDDGIKVWVNRRLVLDRGVARSAAPGQDEELFDLKAGWSELLVKVDNIGSEWAFYVELRDPATNKAAKSLKFSLYPPSGPPSNSVRRWQIIGPFPNRDDRGHQQPFPPETDRIDLTQQHEGIQGKIRWKLHQSETDKIDLQEFLNHDRAGVAYALCWVRSAKRKALLATGSDDGIKVWINRRVVLDQAVHREAVPGEDRVPVELKPDWNEILVKIDNRFGTWAFFLELREEDGSLPLDDVEHRLTPPQGDAVWKDPPAEKVVKFLRNWQIVGPLPEPPGGGYGKVYDVEKERIDLGKEYAGIRGRVRWKPHGSKSDLIDLRRICNHNEKAVAFAVCWLHSEQKRSAELSIGSDDGIKIWIDRKLVFGGNAARAASPGQDRAKVELKAGWQEMLVKVDNRGGSEWGFFLELQDPKTRQTIPNLRVRTTPPEGGKK